MIQLTLNFASSVPGPVDASAAPQLPKSAAAMEALMKSHQAHNINHPDSGLNVELKDMITTHISYSLQC